MARKVIRIEDLKDQIFTSRHYGPFRVLNEEPRSDKAPHIRRVRIQFDNTGHEKVVQLCNVFSGNVRDSGNPDSSTPRRYGARQDIDMSKIYQSTFCGPVEIIKDYGYAYPGQPTNHMVRVRFLNTGYEDDVMYQNLIRGYVRDKSLPGFMSTKREPLHIERSVTRDLLQRRWSDMMNRCNNPNYRGYNFYGGLGVRVCERWHNSDAYIEDVQKILGFHLFLQYPALYQLDKDYTQSTKPKYTHVYSPETCVWLERHSNGVIMVNLYPTDYAGVMYSRQGFVAVVYESNWCRLLTYGPFEDIESAARFFYMQPHHPEILAKLPQTKMPTPGPINFKGLKPLYHLV